MNTHKWLIVMIVVALAVLALAVAPGLAQETEPGGQAHPQSKTDAAAVMDNRIPIQGQLTGSGGTSLDGNYDLTLRLYDVEVGGSALCTDTHAIDVDNGLFSTYLAGCATHVDGQQQLYLGIQVESDGEMTPRQPIYPVPYALTLRPGAKVRGSSSTTPTLSVSNSTGKGIVGGGNIGIEGLGGVWGVHGQAVGFSGYGVFGEALLDFSNNATHGVYGLTRSGYPASAGVLGEATGIGIGVQAKSQSGTALNAASTSGTTIYAGGTGIIRSAADTEIAVSPLNMIAYWESSGDVQFLPAGTYMEVRPLSSGFQYVLVPITLPSRLFGAATKFESIRVCYRCDQAASSISTTIVRTATDEGLIDDGLNDSTARNSTEWDCYTITEPTPFVINGSMYLQLTFEFGGTGSTHDIRIGNITLTLTEQ